MPNLQGVVWAIEHSSSCATPRMLFPTFTDAMCRRHASWRLCAMLRSDPIATGCMKSSGLQRYRINGPIQKKKYSAYRVVRYQVSRQLPHRTCRDGSVRSEPIYLLLTLKSFRTSRRGGGTIHQATFSIQTFVVR
jgi:hypothetical protein